MHATPTLLLRRACLSAGHLWRTLSVHRKARGPSDACSTRLGGTRRSARHVMTDGGQQLTCAVVPLSLAVGAPPAAHEAGSAVPTATRVDAQMACGLIRLVPLLNGLARAKQSPPSRAVAAVCVNHHHAVGAPARLPPGITRAGRNRPS